MPPTMLLLLALISPALAATCDFSRWNAGEQQAILGVHNDLRSKIARGDYWIRGMIKGPASDMLQMEYDCGLERSAQRAADMCPTIQIVGENIYWSSYDERLELSSQVINAAKKWEQEFHDYSWPSAAARPNIVRAAQMAWSRTSKVGCGVKQCQQDRLIVVCHYSPIGNIKGQDVYSPGAICSVCPYGTVCNRSTGLCTTGQSQIDHDGNEERTTNKDLLSIDVDEIIQAFDQRFENISRFQDIINSIVKRWGPLESEWKALKIPKFRKFWKRNYHVFDKWINCRKGRAHLIEWNEGAFRVRCEQDGSTSFIGCIARDGSMISAGTVRTVGGIETTCKKHANGTVSMEMFQQQRDSYTTSGITQNDEKETDNQGLVKEGKNNMATVIGRNVLEQPTTGNRVISDTPVDFELSSQCAEPLFLGYNGTCNQRSKIMWYMDKETLTCLAFKYTGCGGNRNRFATKDECQRTCLPSDFQTCPANSQPIRRPDNTSHCNPNGANRLDCPAGSVCKMGYAVGLCCDAEISRRVDANYASSCSQGKQIYKSRQFGTKLIHLGKSCSHDFCPVGASCHQGEYFAYCCQ